MSSLKIRVIFEILLNSIVCFLQFSSSYNQVRLIIKVDLFSRFYGIYLHIFELFPSIPLFSYHVCNCTCISSPWQHKFSFIQRKMVDSIMLLLIILMLSMINCKKFSLANTYSKCF